MTRGKRLLAARNAAEMSRTAVARTFDIENSTIYRWERDQSAPSVKQLEQLARLYRVRAAWLAFGDGAMGLRPLAKTRPKTTAQAAG